MYLVIVILFTCVLTMTVEFFLMSLWFENYQKETQLKREEFGNARYTEGWNQAVDYCIRNITEDS